MAIKNENGYFKITEATMDFINNRTIIGTLKYKTENDRLIEKNISPATLRKDLNIATGTMTKMRRNEDVALSVLLRICEYLDCNIGDICDAVKTEKNI